MPQQDVRIGHAIIYFQYPNGFPVIPARHGDLTVRDKYVHCGSECALGTSNVITIGDIKLRTLLTLATATREYSMWMQQFLGVPADVRTNGPPTPATTVVQRKYCRWDDFIQGNRIRVYAARELDDPASVVIIKTITLSRPEHRTFSDQERNVLQDMRKSVSYSQ